MTLVIYIVLLVLGFGAGLYAGYRWGARVVKDVQIAASAAKKL